MQVIEIALYLMLAMSIAGAGIVILIEMLDRRKK